MKYTFKAGTYDSVAIEADSLDEAVERFRGVLSAFDLVAAGHMRVYRLPKTLVDHIRSCGWGIQGSFVVVRETKSHYYAALDSAAHVGLYSEAARYVEPKDDSPEAYALSFWPNRLFGVQDSAKWTLLALLEGPVRGD